MKRLQFHDPPTPEDLELFQGMLAEAFAPGERCPLLKGNLLEGVRLAAGTTRVDHRLQRKPRGWIVTSKDAAGDIYQPASQPNPGLQLSLTATAALVVDLWVF